MEKLKILIVEDEILIRAHLSDIVESCGCTIVGETPRGEEAVIMARDLKPDLVLMDIRLKGKMDGIEAAKIINAGRTVPVAFVSAYEIDDVSIDDTVPVSFFLGKPIDRYTLTPVLEHIQAPMERPGA